MRSLLALSLMMVVAVVGCTAPSVGSYPNRDDRKAPSRDPSDDDDDTAAADDDTGSTTSSQTAPPVTPATGQALTIASTGGGQGDVTCNGAPCTGSLFPAGTSVTVAATPKSGSIFTGWTGGGCTGSEPCKVTVGGAAPTAKFETLSGNWVGTYTNKRPNGACTFTNAGAVTQAIAGTPGSYTAAVSTINGLEIRNLNGCGLVDTREGTAPAEATAVNGDTVTGTWNVKISGLNGTLAFPFTAKLTGNKMTGTWTCTNCTGGFEVTKQ